MKPFIAKRRLLYSLKSSNLRKEFVIGILTPQDLEEGDAPFQVGKDGCASCIITIEGMEGYDAFEEVVYGADSLQAITLATSGIEAILRRIQKKLEYDFFFLDDGSSYFES